ncbi:kinesin-like protein KIF20B isoform X2 [Pangasianodon hypophthalmus]|uniref:kinesin-like protein KIF20B isoform X2 n=1 Tax=Pangasianodon hypophthalmus TaxID=310915 RepID=UPI0023083464|nr:kinesin-like protein KIF20B isoform X2 [Pangasianodon hypophthalmus]
MMESCFNDKVARAETILVEDLRRDLRFDLTEIAEAQDSSCLDREFLQVYLRIRPFSQAEIENGESQDCVTIHPPDTVLLKAPRSSLSARASDKSVPQTAQRFQFSQVFGADTLQKDLFDGTVRNLVKDVLEGKNSLVFTYGVTNAGKTFTFLGPEHDVGILPRSLNMIFSSLEGRIFTQTSVKPHRCQDVLKLSKEQQVEENISKRHLLRLLRENDTQKNTSSLSSSSRSEGSDLADPDSSVSDRSFSVDADPHTRFSVWVSFCEIYNENIHDLLEQPSGTGTRRANLRLCQDTKGNSFIKDLRWVQVNSSDEAFKVMKLGKKNQSISSTKLNQLSSRSHSIFTVRILRIEDVASLSVQSVSELSLCDLAGSERCGKTQNKGDRLKEAGNINTSLLSLGKCISALKGSQQARQHVPFRESKLTHYLQGFFTGRGRAAMIVNVNQCASMYDETLNVLKFSAVAQKVVVLSVPSVLSLVVKRSAREVSFIINKATQREARRTSLVRWEHGRVDGNENENEVSEEEDEDEEEESLLEETLQEDEGKETVLLDKEVYENQLLQLEELQEQLRMARAETVAVESRIREEVTKEFSELFTQMQNDYNERVSKERELVEERCERRLQIFKQLVEKTTRETRSDDGEDPAKAQEREPPSLDGMFDSMSTDLAGIRKDAEAAQSCLVTCDARPSVTLRDLEKKVTELTEKLSDTQKQLESRTQELDAQSGLVEQLEDMRKTLQSREQRLNDLVVMCVEKDDIITKVQADLDRAVEDRTKNSALIKDLQQKHNCTCSERRTLPETRKRRQEGAGPEDIHGQPPLKKGSLKDTTTSEDPMEEEEDEEAPTAEVKESPDVFSVCDNDSSMTEVKGQVDRLQTELRQKDEQVADLERERQTLEFCIQDLKSKLEEEKRSRAGLLQETEQKIEEEQQRKFHSIITRMNEMDKKLGTAEKTCAALRTSKMEQHGPEIEHKNTVIKNLEQEVTRLKQDSQNVGDAKARRDEVSRLQKENESKAERVKLLEHQLIENKNIHENLQRVNFDLQAEVTNLKGVIKGLEEKAALLVRENTLKQKEKTETELSDREAQLAKREAELAAKEAELAAVQEEAQEARKREVERRRELLAVAEEAIAQKDAELQKREAEITRLKEEMKCSSEKLSSLSLDMQRRADESSDLREKLADSKKQIQQVQREICSMRDVEKSLKQKLSDVEKTKSQLQSELSNRDRTIQQLRSSRSSDSKTEDHVHLYKKALKDLQQREGVIEEMRLVLSEQEETQTQMDLELENRETQIHQLSQELENLKELLLKQRSSKQFHHHEPAHSDDITRAKEEAAQAQDNLKMVSEKHQAERRKWTEEKLVLIAQAKDAEERRNQDMRRYAEDRERHARQHTEMESMKACLAEREQEMDEWRKERDTLVSALEVQLMKLVSTIAEKDEQIRELKRTDTLQPPEVCDSGVMEQLKEKEAELKQLREQLRETTHTHTTTESSTQTVLVEECVSERLVDSTTLKHTSRTRASVTSQGSCGSGPSVLDSSVISTETGRCSRFPRPELEISFSSLQPERFRLKRPGDTGEITVNVSHTHNTRKRKSSEVERDGVDSENRRNMRCKKAPGLPAHQEEEMSPALVGKSSHNSQLSVRGKKEGKLQKIGDFLNSSPTFLGSKAKRIMGLMSGRSPDEGGSSLSLKRTKRKINISSPMNISANQIISRDVEEREDQLNIKKRLRTKTPK